MQRMIAQHTLHNSKHHCYLLCKCKQGCSVTNLEHVCEIVNEDHYGKLFQKSERKFLKREVKKKEWTLKKHCE